MVLLGGGRFFKMRGLIVLAHRHLDQWNRTDDTEINPHNYRHQIFKKGVKNIHWRKTDSSTNTVGKN
jgi:hypothetical protein